MGAKVGVAAVGMAVGVAVGMAAVGMAALRVKVGMAALRVKVGMAAVGMAAVVAAEVEGAERTAHGHGHWARRSPNYSCHAARSMGCTLKQHPMPASGTKRTVQRRLLAPLTRDRHRAAARPSCHSCAAAHAA